MRRTVFAPAIALFAFLGVCLAGCAKPPVTGEIPADLRFTLKYGNFEDEINLFTASGDVNTFVVMRDGLFYIVNGESRKIMQFNSYGDLLTFHYNSDATPAPAFEHPRGAAPTNEAGQATQRSERYPFINPGLLAVDKRKHLFVVDQVPPERQERDLSQRLLLSAVVFRFSAEGSFMDYIGQQGPGGTPFPYIKNISVTAANELVVVCQASTGMIVYWYSAEGFLLYTVPIHNADVPGQDAEKTVLPSLKKIIPDPHQRILYVDIDYYHREIDSESGVQYGTTYDKTLVYSFDVVTAEYLEALNVPPLGEEDYFLTWDLLGITDNGHFFFHLVDDTGYKVQIINSQDGTIKKQHLSLPRESSDKELLYSAFSLSAEGIISGILADSDSAKVAWWRCDSLLAPSGEGAL
jgi:hypothetical protein